MYLGINGGWPDALRYTIFLADDSFKKKKISLRKNKMRSFYIFGELHVPKESSKSATLIAQSRFISSYEPGSPGLLPFVMVVSMRVPTVWITTSVFSRCSANVEGLLASPFM